MNSFKEKLTVREVKAALKTLPKGSDAYDVAYSAAMERIFAQGKESSEMAKKILSWLLCARRPLSTLELLHALAIEVGDTEIDQDNILDTEQVLTICAGLVTLDEQSDNVRFIHYTTQEYLQRKRGTWLPHAEIEIVRTCTAYLSIDELSVGPCSSNKEYQRRIETLRLLDYAAVNWGAHMSALTEADLDSELGREAQKEAWGFFSNFEYLESAMQALFMSGRHSSSESTVVREVAGYSGSHWIGRFGLATFFGQWGSGKVQWDNRDLCGRTPLSWAAGEGHEAVTKLLLETGEVDADSEDYLDRTPLSWASVNGQEATAKLLLDKGVDVNSKDVDGETPLCTAVSRGDEVIVRLLLNTKQVDITGFGGRWSKNPLKVAVVEGHQVIAKLLLDYVNAHTETSYGDYQTLLDLACAQGQEAVVKLLLGTGQVDVNCKNTYGQTPLFLAAMNGQESLVKLLLDTGKVDVNSCDVDDRSALEYATEKGHGEVMKLLLEAGAVPILEGTG